MAVRCLKSHAPRRVSILRVPQIAGAGARARWRPDLHLRPRRPDIIRTATVAYRMSSLPVSAPVSGQSRFFGARPDRPDAARPPAALRAGDARRGALREGRMAEPRRVGQGSGGGADDRRRRSLGRAQAGLTIVDATSGNTGIAYAMVGAARGYKVKLCLPENASPERKLILRAFGAELVLTESARRDRRRDPRSAPDGGRAAASSISIRISTATTATGAPISTRPGPEIIEQTGGRADAFRRRPRHERHVHGHRPGAARSSIRRSG